MKINAFSQKLCVWSGPAMAVTMLTAFALMGFIPPPDPRLNGDEIVTLFTQDQGRIQVGGLVMIFGSALLFPWISVISVQLRRIEGQHNPMGSTQLASGALGAFLFLTPMIMIQALAYKPENLTPAVAETLYYFSWLFFCGTPIFGILQNLAITVAILQDTSSGPVFPRWVGYFNLWAAMLFVPGTACYFFDEGPFSWRGVFVWWIPLTVFSLWIAVMTAVLLRAINAQSAAKPQPGAVEALDAIAHPQFAGSSPDPDSRTC